MQAHPLFVISSNGVQFMPDPKTRPNVYFKIRRINVFDGIDFAELSASVVATAGMVGKDISDLMGDSDTKDDKTSVFRSLIATALGLPSQFEKVVKFLAPFVQDDQGQSLTTDDFRTEKMPLGAVWRMCDALAYHPDFEDFLEGARQTTRKLKGRNPQLAKWLEGLSMTSGGSQNQSPTETGGTEPLISSGRDTV